MEASPASPGNIRNLDQPGTVLEREKWDRYYADLPVTEAEKTVQGFNAELLACISEILPAGSRILEAGCGGGWQSLEIARAGRYKVSLMDFSQNALAYARRLFERAELCAEFIDGDVLVPGEPEFDLVFNSGVLEHYSLEEQSAFLRGMASRSRNFVLVFVPNRSCYWYWLSRVEKSGAGQWPFGKEVPLADLSAAFEGAGLRYLGRTFSGEGWTEIFVNGLSGMEEKLRQLILSIHRSPLIMKEQKCYLLGALGSVRQEEISLPARWVSRHSSENLQIAELTAALADALALAVGEQSRMKEYPHQGAEKEQRLEALMAQLQKALGEKERLVQEWLEVASRHRRALETLTQELAQLKYREEAKDRAKLRNRLRVTVFPFRHPIQWLELQRGYWRLRSSIKRLLIRILPVWAKHAIRRLRYGNNSYPSPQLSNSAVRDLEKQHNRPRAHEWLEKADSYSTLTLLPAVPAEQLTSILAREITPMALRRPDVICFSIIDWDFRYQRPQQMMSQFAAHGHRVFYLSTTRFMPHTAKPRAAVKIICDNVYEVSLAVPRPPNVYGEVMDGEIKAALLASLEELRRDHHIHEAIGYVMIASWGGVALQSQQRWGWRIVYDCMDNWENFPGVKWPILGMESTLVQNCDLLSVTAKRLFEKWSAYERPMILVRNGVDFDFYARNTLPNTLLSGLKHPIIGYFGAIADWFDVELLAHVARQRPDYNFVLLGGIFDTDVSALMILPNVHIQGQQPYESMPQYLYHFNVCIIPFKVNPITEATDPVKLYEYLSAGKPVVAVALPELEPYRELLYIAKNQEDFLLKLDMAVAENDPHLVSRRRSFAREHTWNERYGSLEEGLARIVPRSSIVVVTHNNLAYTRLCLESIVRNTEYPNYEVIVVDNNSTDGTQEYLQRTSKLYPNVSVILNEDNHGFARANNQGIAQSNGEYLILLNNDTVVPPGWLSRLLRHLRSHEIGMVGPVTNFAGNEARIDVSYRTWAQMEAFARERANSFDGLAAEIHMLAMFCVAFRRSTYHAVGPLDEDYGAGLFEDDDYAYRLRAKGYRIICAGDVYVHHFGQASFKNLLQTGEYDALWERNRRRFEKKWDTKWIPHFDPLQFHSLEALSHRQNIVDSTGRHG